MTPPATSLVLQAPTAVAPTRVGPGGRWWNAAGVAVVAVAYLALGWHRRWIADDGLIVTRTVRQVLAGHGPVFNIGERVEANTSTLWTYVLVAAGWVTGADIGLLAVLIGLLLAAAGLALGLDAARRLHTRTAGNTRVLPLGGLVVLALPPFWDFATSGLETGLVFAWLAGTWWALVRCAQRGPRWAATGAAVLAGLAPLVRPELAIAGVAYLVALWWLRGRGTRRALTLAGAAAVLPLGYQVFRMGYYGMVVPQTAIAKEAGSALWGRGLTYAGDFVLPYALWLPLLGALVALGLVLRRSRLAPGTVPLVLAPLVPGVLLTAYVLRVGGDFMHARMLLPPLFLLLLPVMTVPVRRASVALFAVTAVWALVCGTHLRVGYSHRPLPLQTRTGIADERQFWVDLVRDPHPVTAESYLAHFPLAPAAVALVRAQGPVGVVWDPMVHLERLQPRAGLPWSFVLVMPNDGVAGALTGLDEASVDPLGLTYPLAAHAELGARDRPGHEKRLPDSYLLADIVAPGTALPAAGPSAAEVDLARRAISCGEIAELQAAVRAPLTPGRFWSNLTGAARRSSFRVPLDPAAAVARFCR